jgi:GR25 family glycosyltransferase involved in LPS biosynthesis
MALQRNEPVTIFEDDAIVHRDSAAVSAELLNELGKDWDFVMWGWNFDAPIGYEIFPNVPTLTRFSERHLRNNWHQVQQAQSKHQMHKLHFAFGTVCYSVSPQGVKKVTDSLFPIRPVLYKSSELEIESLSIDCHLATLFPQMNAYICINPLVVTQNDRSSSTVQEDHLPRSFSQKFKAEANGSEACPQKPRWFCVIALCQLSKEP